MGKIVLTLLMLASVIGRATPGSAGNVAVIMSADVGPYREALRGFKGQIAHRIVAEYDMEGDFDEGRKVLAEIESKDKPDLIFAVGIWALQVVAGQTTNLPVVYAMVLNPPAILQASTAKNITGASMNVPVDQTIRLFKRLGIQRVGIIFDPSKTGYLVRRASSVGQKEGIQLITKEIHSSKEAIQALNSLKGQIDALWILPDETILDQRVLRGMLLFSYRQKVPVVGLSERQAKMGAVLSLRFGSSEDIGRQAAELANHILAGKTAAEIPFTTARLVKLIVNLKAAQKLGMEIPESVLEMATTIIQ